MMDVIVTRREPQPVVNRNDFIVQIGDVLRVDDDCRTKMTSSQPDDQVGPPARE
jgi:hypothetical protein